MATSDKKLKLFRNNYSDKYGAITNFQQLRTTILGSNKGASEIARLDLKDGEPLVYRYGSTKNGFKASALAIAHTEYKDDNGNAWLDLYASTDSLNVFDHTLNKIIYTGDSAELAVKPWMKGTVLEPSFNNICTAELQKTDLPNWEDADGKTRPLYKGTLLNAFSNIKAGKNVAFQLTDFWTVKGDTKQRSNHIVIQAKDTTYTFKGDSYISFDSKLNEDGVKGDGSYPYLINATFTPTGLVKTNDLKSLTLNQGGDNIGTYSPTTGNTLDFYKTAVVGDSLTSATPSTNRYVTTYTLATEKKLSKYENDLKWITAADVLGQIGTLTITQNGTGGGTYNGTATTIDVDDTITTITHASGDDNVASVTGGTLSGHTKAYTIKVPKKLSSYTNDAGFIKGIETLTINQNGSPIATFNGTKASKADLRNDITIVKGTGMATVANPAVSADGYTKTYTVNVTNSLSAFDNDAGFITSHQTLNDLTLTIDGSTKTYNPKTGASISITTIYSGQNGIDVTGRKVGLKNTVSVAPSTNITKTASVHNGIIYYDDTTYTDFAGSAHGLVPESSTSNAGKFLRGDGHWGIPANTTYSSGNGVTVNNLNNDHTISLTDFEGNSSSSDSKCTVKEGIIYYKDTNTTYSPGSGIDVVQNGAISLKSHTGTNSTTDTNEATVANGVIKYTDTKYTGNSGVTVSGKTVSLTPATGTGGDDTYTANVAAGKITYTDTRYSDFAGGASGLVPTPSAEIGKEGFLNHKGQWVDIATTDTKYTITEITTPTDTTSAKEYKLCVSGSTVAVGDIIKIPKYSELESAKVRDEGGKQYIDFVYILANGSKKTITVDVSTFITMNEFEDGLELTGQKVKARLGKGLKFDSTKTATKRPIMLNIGGSTPSNIGKGADTTGNMDSMLSVDDNGLHISNVIDCGTF